MDTDGRRRDGPARLRATRARSSRNAASHWGSAGESSSRSARLTGDGGSPTIRTGTRARAAPGSVNGTAETSIRVYGCARLRDHRRDRPDLEQPAEVHDADAVGHLADDREIVRDQQHRQSHLAAQRLQQAENLRARRHVERGHRFVGDQHLRLGGERAGEHDALALPARELVRKAVEEIAWRA